MEHTMVSNGIAVAAQVEKIGFASESAKREFLLQRIRDISEVLAADVEEAERIRTLPRRSVEALRESGLYGLKTPACSGGFEADLATQLAVFEEVAYVNPSASWSLFVSTAGLGLAASHLPKAGHEDLFAKRDFPTFASGGGYLLGKLAPCEGGYRLSGRWIYGSGIGHADWCAVPARVDATSNKSGEVLTCIVPASAFEIHDTWSVVGLQGSGSFDYSATDVFVPARMTYCRGHGPVRGGGLYRLGNIGFVTVEIVGFMIGVARRAIDELIDLSKRKSRGYVQKSSMISRSVLQRAIADCDLKLKAVRSLNLEIFGRAAAEVSNGEFLSPALEVELRAASTMAAEITTEIANVAFRYGAGSAMRLDSPLQRCLRDLHAAGTHFVVSDTAYEAHGQQLLGMSDASAMA
jgi:indole-3-acetate monooxygenase